MTTKPSACSRRFSRGLTLLAAAPLALACLFVIAVTTVHAAPAVRAGDGAPTITLHHLDRTPATPERARRLYRRLDDAAVDVCGGGDGSFPEFNRAIRDSDCWHTAMRQAFAQIDSPLLPVTLADSRKR